MLTCGRYGPHPNIGQVLGRAHSSIETPFYVFECGTPSGRDVALSAYLSLNLTGSISLIRDFQTSDKMTLLMNFLVHVGALRRLGHIKIDGSSSDR